jgi:acyl-CoA hydrolase/ribosomal protein S18 acetylase RimI-like enzyme
MAATGAIQRILDERRRTAAEAVESISRGQRVFIGSGCAEPQDLVAAMMARAPKLADNPIIHIYTLGTAPYVQPQTSTAFRHNAFFIGAGVRQAVARGDADYTPIFLSEVPGLFRSGRMPIDVAMIQLSPPDEHGYCSYGVSVDITKAATECARTVIAEINPHMPRTTGAYIHVSRLHAIVDVDRPVAEAAHGEPDDVATRIGAHIAELVEDGSTIQIGIGTIPDAVLQGLRERRHLGIHSEMITDSVADLVQAGVIDNSRKTLNPGKLIASFAMGTRRLYDFVDRNPLVEMHPSDYTNDPFLIAQHQRMVAINAALQIDFTGQVCADSIGTYFYSGIGGQVDFTRGAARSKGGKAIIALPSTASGGNLSRIVPMLEPGAGVVTSRGDVRYVVTEYGVADLFGKSVRERTIALIHIAHPKFRQKLMDEAYRLHYVPRGQVMVSDVDPQARHDIESEYTLRDGTAVHFRAAAPTDEELLREFFYALSPRSVYHRFFRPVTELPREDVKAFMQIDQVSDVALVGIIDRGEGQQIIAIGSYSVDMATRAAEVAFIVTDTWQHKGIGRHMFRQLVRIARDRGIVRFTAEVLGDNTAMLRLFHECAAGPVESHQDSGVYRLSFRLAEEVDPGMGL